MEIYRFEKKGQKVLAIKTHIMMGDRSAPVVVVPIEALQIQQSQVIGF